MAEEAFQLSSAKDLAPSLPALRRSRFDLLDLPPTVACMGLETKRDAQIGHEQLPVTVLQEQERPGIEPILWVLAAACAGAD